MFKPHTFCSFCGARFPEGLDWPRTCPACANTTYRNPLPVAVILVPVDNGLLLVRRAVAPHIGKLALPGGYINWGESWQVAGAREVLEETGVIVDPDGIREFRVLSAPDSTVLIFGIAAATSSAILPPFLPNSEASARVIVDAPTELAFSLHTAVAAEFFSNIANLFES